MLKPFIQEFQTLSDAATTLGVKLPLLHYHAKRFVEHELLELTHTEKRAGRTVKFYGATAKDFFITFEFTSSASLAELLTDLGATANANFYRALAHALQQHSSAGGFLWSLAENGEFYSEMLNGPELTEGKEALQRKILAHGTPALVAIHTALSLDYDSAKTLQNDLVELLGRYETEQIANAQRYSFRIGLAPVPSELKRR